MIESNLNVDISNMVDLINIKNFPELIIEYLQSKNEKKYNNLRKFYSTMLDYFSEDIKLSYLNRILKYLSSDVASTINLFDDINEGIYDDNLMSFTKDLVQLINSFDDCSNLYEKINRRINFIFYDECDGDDYCEIKTYNNDKKYVKFIYYLLKHSFRNYKISLPMISAKRLYLSAITLKAGSDRYIRSLYAASLLGNDSAAILLYGSLGIHDRNTACDILLKARENEIILWLIGFDLENNRLNKTLVHIIKNKFKYIWDYSDNFIDNIKVTDKALKKYYDITLLMAFKIYYYCYNKYGYTKAGNSLGKLLIFDLIIYNNDREASINYGKSYLEKEMHKGNINAITNIAIHYYDNPNDNKYELDDVKKIFRTSASFGDVLGNYYLGKILFEEGDFKNSYYYLKYAADQNYGPAFLLLGSYYELKNEYQNAINNYKKGIIYECFDCAYYLALLYFDIYDSNDNKSIYSVIGMDYLKKYNNLFSDDIKNKADMLLKEKNSENF